MKACFTSASAEQYEALRQNAVAREAIFSDTPLGAILVVKTGVAGWMRQWKQCSATVPSIRSLLPGPPELPGWQHELTLLLAQITTRHLSAAQS